MLAAGSTVSGRYRLISLIGEGGMASVWQALDETLQRSVAIKLLYFRAHRDPQLIVEHFLREARIAASIQHRNVVNTVDFGTTEDGVPYMVMELLSGESLAARMERAPRLGMEELVRLASLTLRGLAACHEAGIVHRDLKPANIFLQQDGEGWYPKILDFGISRSLAASELVSVVATQQGLVIGTPHYMAPEQARGEAEIDKRADIYSMGAIIYEGITGQLPFDAPTPSELLVKIMSSAAPSMQSVRADVPELLSDCIAQAMAPDREHRFVDARVFRRALQNAAEHVFRQATPATSELPELALADVRATAPQAANETKPVAPAWGDFEGLGNRSDRPATAAISGPPIARQQPSVPAPAAPSRARSAPLRAQSRPLSGSLLGALPRAQSTTEASGARAQASSTVDGPLLGDNPLDAFSEGAAALDLDIDYGSQGKPRVSRQSPPPRSGKQIHATGHVVHAERKSQASVPPGRPSALWILTALLALGVLVALFAPQLFSAPPPDEAAAIQQEAQNPATRGSDRRLTASTSTRPVDLAKTRPALRDVP
jgi:serine/threonine protein kinase